MNICRSIVDPMKKRSCQCHGNILSMNYSVCTRPFHCCTRTQSSDVNHCSLLSTTDRDTLLTTNMSNTRTSASTLKSIDAIDAPLTMDQSIVNCETIRTTTSTKRTAAMALDDVISDNEHEEQKQTYDFSPTDAL
jgi:hypothetical protein